MLYFHQKEIDMKDNDAILTNVERRENVFLNRVYLKMVGALLLTAVVAFFVAQSATLMRFVVLNPFSMLIMALVQMGLVMYLSMKVETMSTAAAHGCFIGYSVITGITFSTIVTAFAGTMVITKAFVSAAVVFGLAAIYGAVTKKSLKGWMNWLMMSLVGVLVATLINMIFRSSMLDLMITIVGVLIFTLLTAWDSQKLTSLNRSYGSYMTADELSKISIMGALDLYLDFINIFLYFVRIFGRSNDN